jgi:hypothetical protein
VTWVAWVTCKYHVSNCSGESSALGRLQQTNKPTLPHISACRTAPSLLQFAWKYNSTSKYTHSPTAITASTHLQPFQVVLQSDALSRLLLWGQLRTTPPPGTPATAAAADAADAAGSSAAAADGAAGG